MGNSMKIPSVIVTSLFVGAAGAITAILFAPDKGKKTRDRIAQKGQEYKHYVMDSYNNLAESVSHPFESVADQMERLTKKTVKKAANLKK
jgi:gas vesicle protein